MQACGVVEPLDVLVGQFRRVLNGAIKVFDLEALKKVFSSKLS